MQWTYSEPDIFPTQELVRSLKISPYLAGLLVRLGKADPIEAQEFLDPKLASLEDPFKLTNMSLVIDRIFQAIDNKDTITIVGDYDVDGVTSTTLLVTILKKLNLKTHFFIPRRMEDGYGLSHSIIERALSESTPQLFIALDCGTNSHEEADYLHQKGIDLIIIDHHKSKESLPKNALLINPHVFDGDDKPWSQLCTVGLVFKLIHALFKKLKEKQHPLAEKTKLRDYLDLVAMGTVADLVILSQENRILTSHGLRMINNASRPGVRALCKVSGLNLGQEMKPSDVAFRLGPRINASGRLADATLPVKMLLSDSEEESKRVAQELDTMNKERQDIERLVIIEAEKIVEKEKQHETHSIVLYGPSWHSGVVGIVAGRVARSYHRPSIVLGKEGKLAKGSGRSIPGIDLIKALTTCEDILESWGGHPMAAGIALFPENLEEFKTRFEDGINAQLTNSIPEPTLEIAEWIPLNALNSHFLYELDKLHPFGNGNPEPVFGLEKVILNDPPSVFAKDHFRFRVNPQNDLSAIDGIAWKMADNIPPHNKPIDLAVKFGWNNWNGNKYPQLQLIDWRFS